MPYRTRGTQGYQWDAQRVKALRSHLGLTQQQLSEELGIRQQTVSEWETGMYRPRGASRTVLRLIAERAGFEYRVSPPEGMEGEIVEEVEEGPTGDDREQESL